MSSVVVIFRIYPKDGFKIEDTVSEIKSKLKPADLKTEEVAFGIKLIRVAFKYDDSTMGSSKIESELNALESVGEVEVEDETLI